MLLSASHLQAQCDVKIQRNLNGYGLTVGTPQSGSSYTWEATGGLSGQGLSFEAPLGAEVVVFRDGAEANRLAFSEGTDCAEVASFSYLNHEACNGCAITFQPFSFNVLGHLWEFGDGNYSNDPAPTYTYAAPGTYTVVHTVVVPGTGGSIFQAIRCSLQITVNCGGSPVRERVECCRLILNICPGSSSAGCTHLWEVLNGNGVVCLTSTDPAPEFVLDNINTYDNGTVTVRHTNSCTSTVETFVHTIENQGIFVGDGVDPNNPVPYTTATGPLNNNQPLFPSFTVSGQKVFVDCILDINNPAAAPFQIEFQAAQVCFSGDAGLDVSHRLFVNEQSSLYNGCETAWRGIMVRPNASGLTMYRASVRGAVFAVHYRSGGGVVPSLSMSYNKLSSNFIGLYSESPMGSPYILANTFSSGALPQLGVTSVQNVQNITGGYSQTGSFAGIFLRNVPTFAPPYTYVGNPGIPTSNTFIGGANGMYLENVFATIRYSQFTGQMPHSGYIQDNTGHGIFFRHTAPGSPGTLNALNNTISVQGRGIHVESVSGNTQADIGNQGNPNTIGARTGVMLEQRPGGRFVNTTVAHNTISTRAAGVHFSCDPTPNASAVTIRKNTVTALQGDGILLTGPNPGNQNIVVQDNAIAVHHTQGISGIHLLGFNGARVDDNNRVTIPNVASRAIRGIWLEDSRNSVVQGNTVTGAFPAGNTVVDNNAVHLANSTDNLIANNRCENTSRGLVLFGDCIAPERLRCNTFKGTGFGLFYTDLSLTGNQTNTGNHWDDTRFLPGGNLTGAAHEGDYNMVLLSQYRTLQGASIQYPQTFELQPGVSSGNWFDLGQNAACDPPPPFAPTEAEQLAAGVGIPVGNDYADGFNWVARRYLYRKLLENPGLTALATEFQPFLNAAAGNAIGAYELLRQNAQSAGALDAAAEQQVLALTADADAALAEMHDILDEIETQSPTGAALAQLLSDYAAAEADLTAVYAQIGQVLAPFQTAVSQHAAQAPAAIGALPATEAWEAREKTLIGMTYKARNGQWLTGADRAYILETAEACPWEAGLATYAARALWFHLTGEVLPDPECVATAERTNGTTAAVAGDLTVYPNPVAGWLQLRLSGETAQRDGLRYQLHNALGAMVQEGQIAGVAADISVQTIPVGMYIFRVLHGDTLLHATKIAVIQR